MRPHLGIIRETFLDAVALYAPSLFSLVTSPLLFTNPFFHRCQNVVQILKGAVKNILREAFEILRTINTAKQCEYIVAGIMSSLSGCELFQMGVIGAHPPGRSIGRAEPT